MTTNEPPLASPYSITRLSYLAAREKEPEPTPTPPAFVCREQ